MSIFFNQSLIERVVNFSLAKSVESSFEASSSLVEASSSLALNFSAGDFNLPSATAMRSASHSITLTTALSKAFLNFLALSALANRMARVSVLDSSSEMGPVL